MHSRVPQSLEYVLEQRSVDGLWVVIRYRHNRKYMKVIGPYASRAEAEYELGWQRDLDRDERQRARTA